jgi:hypothetical protein
VRPRRRLRRRRLPLRDEEVLPSGAAVRQGKIDRVDPEFAS